MTLPRSVKLTQLIRDGIPHSMRSELWIRLSGAQRKKLKSEVTYPEIIEASTNDNIASSKAIEKDLLRTMPNNACFSNLDSLGIPR